MAPSQIRLGAIVLAGGVSSRMGAPKALLDWHGTPLLSRVVGVVARVASPVVVVHGAGQELPALPAGTGRAVDGRPGRGPLEGIAAGMEALAGRAEAAFVTSTDAPFLHPSFVERVAAALGDHDAVLPRPGGHNHPLAAVYRLSLLPRVRELLAADRLRPFFLLESVRTRVLDEFELGDITSLRNLNTKADYEAALREPQPEIQVSAVGSVCQLLGYSERVVRASTLGSALAALPGCAALGDHIAIALNGERFQADPALPLVEGDRLVLGRRDEHTTEAQRGQR